jgi:hypothetical protein
MEPTTTDWIQAGASVLTMMAAIVAALIAAKAPRLAAKYAEDYRRENAKADEAARLKSLVFQALMKGRQEIMNADSRAAINLVEVAFHDDPKVRNARRMFTKAATAEPFDAEQLIARYLDLIASVAGALGLGDSIDRFDIESGYYPTALGKIDEAAIADAEKKLAERAQSNAQQGNRPPRSRRP